MLPIGNIVQMLGFVVLMSAGQILFKKAALSTTTLNSFDGLISLFTNLWFWLAIILYGTGTLLWIVILQNVKLSIAYPMSAMAFVLVPLAASYFFGESLSPSYAVGVMLLISGIAVIALKA